LRRRTLQQHLTVDAIINRWTKDLVLALNDLSLDSNQLIAHGPTVLVPEYWTSDFACKKIGEIISRLFSTTNPGQPLKDDVLTTLAAAKPEHLFGDLY
jgi:hypothetical protein